MSLDSSLKTGDELGRHRNVLTRAERIQILARRDEFDGEPLHLPKVAHRKILTGKK